MAQQVSDFELAHVVLAYLETKGWAKTAASFQREAKTLFKSGRRPQGQSVRVLDDLVNGYLQMAAREAQRTALCHVNPLAAHMYGLLDMLAGLPPPLPMPQMPNQTQHQHQQQEAAANAAAAAAAAAMMPIAEMGGGAQPLMDPRQPSQPPQQPQLPTAPPQRPATTPGRHVQRKGAPQRKRRRLDADFEAARPLMPQSPPEFPNSNEHSLLGDVPFGDLLYRAVDPAAVMHVLDHEDEALNKFSSLLADNINRTAMGPDHFHEAPEMLFTDLLLDPEAQEIVKRMVGTAAEGDGGPVAAPPPLLRQQNGQTAEDKQRQTVESPDDEPGVSYRAGRAAGRPSNGAAAAAVGDGGAPQDEDDVQYYKDNPDELEDLLDDIVG